MLLLAPFQDAFFTQARDHTGQQPAYEAGASSGKLSCWRIAACIFHAQGTSRIRTCKASCIRPAVHAFAVGAFRTSRRCPTASPGIRRLPVFSNREFGCCKRLSAVREVRPISFRIGFPPVCNAIVSPKDRSITEKKLRTAYCPQLFC